MATAHIESESLAFAKTVLLPGDPLRARFIAQHWLEDVIQVNGVRNMLGYTGQYKGRPISVMGSGMGIPSISIYAKELITEYGVERLIRVGSCGAVLNEIALGDIIVGMGAGTDSNVNRIRFGGYDLAALADFELLEQLVACAREKGQKLHIGNLFSSDLFYTPDPNFWSLMARYRILGVEMEAAGLYGVAAEYGAKALCLCSVSDHIPQKEQISAAEREKGFSQMLELALDAFI